MAFKNFDVAKRFAAGTADQPQEPETKPAQEEKKAAVKKKVTAKPVIEKAGEKVMKDKNGVSFLQKAAFKRTAVLNIRITEETKANIDILAKKYGLSQSDLVTALVTNAMEQEAKTVE